MGDEDGLRSVGSRAFDGALITLAYLPIFIFSWQGFFVQRRNENYQISQL